MSYRTRDTIRDRFDEVDSLNDRLNRLLNRPDIDEMNDRMEVKKNTKWNYGLSVSKKACTIVIGECWTIHPKIFSKFKFAGRLLRPISGKREPNFKAWTIFFYFQNEGRQDATRETIRGDDSLTECCV